MQVSKLQLLGLVTGGVILGSTLSVTAQESPAPQPAKKHRVEGRKHGHFAAKGFHGAMRGEFVLPGRDGGPVRTVRIDRGILTAVEGQTLVIREEDNTVVRVPLSDETKINRDGNKAALSDLKSGDHVFAQQAKEGDAAFVTRGVRAISAERYAQMEAQREKCRQDRASCPRPQKAERRAPGERKGAAPGAEGQVHPGTFVIPGPPEDAVAFEEEMPV
ncbi:MAG TPA: hypothetical protein VNE62_03625 [Actinomycetota bacterium]|nr:hypothetical protein [Actinomycetota bacterium]